MMKGIQEMDRSWIDTPSMKVTTMLSSIVKFQVKVAALVRDRSDRGATAVEYGLMVALIAVVIIGAVTLLGQQLSSLFTGVTNKLPSP
jgi:pilus assembly protein Flp/PilA